MEFKLKDYLSRITLFQAAVSKDEKQIAYVSNLTGRPQVWTGKISDSEGSVLFPKPVTHDHEKLPYIFEKAIEWIDKNQLVVMYDVNGDENTKIKVINFKTGAETEVPHGDGRDFYCFADKAGEKIFLTSNRKDLRTQSLYIFDVKSKKLKKAFGQKNMWTKWAFPKELKKDHMLIYQTPSNTEQHLKLIDLQSKKVTSLIEYEDTSVDVVDVLSSSKILILTDCKRQFKSLAIFHVKSGEIEYLQKDKWNVEHANLSKDKKNIYIVKNVKGQSHLASFSFPDMKVGKVKFKKEGVISRVQPGASGRYLYISYMSPIEPTNVYRLDLKTNRNERLTDTQTTRVPEDGWSLPKVIKFKSQNKDIYSLFFMPKKKVKGKKTPVLIWPHGGPQWQERPQFRPIFQYLLSQGIAVWAHNPHGSTGFGVDFAKAVSRRWGDVDLPDMENSIEWLKKSGLVDPKRIAIMGGSYGGYMTLRSITKIPKTFKVAVDIFGVSNLVSFVESVPEDWKPMMDDLVGCPKKDLKMLKSQSPINALEKIDCPLLIIQGAKDPRVVKAESDQIYKKMKRLKKPVEYLVFEDEGHGFFKPENELKAYETAVKFIKDHL